jgi:two-component system OmpR family response regulator
MSSPFSQRLRTVQMRLAVPTARHNPSEPHRLPSAHPQSLQQRPASVAVQVPSPQVAGSTHAWLTQFWPCGQAQSSQQVEALSPPEHIPSPHDVCATHPPAVHVEPWAQPQSMQQPACVSAAAHVPSPHTGVALTHPDGPPHIIPGGQPQSRQQVACVSPAQRLSPHTCCGAASIPSARIASGAGATGPAEHATAAIAISTERRMPRGIVHSRPVDARIYVVADAPEAERIAAWLGQEIASPPLDVRPRAATDDAVAEIHDRAPDVVVLAAGLAAGDALAFARAIRGGGADAQLVLIADDAAGVRNAVDARPFGADRFLRRPLSRAALVWAVRSCLKLGRSAVATEAQGAPVAAALSALGDIGPAVVQAPAEVSSAVALHTLEDRLEQATADAIEGFLLDAVEAVLSAPPVGVDEGEEDAAPEPARPRDSTLILSAVTPGPARAPDDARTGTFVSALRRHMSAVEARLFGGGGEAPAPTHEDEGTAEIDLDAIGVTSAGDLPEEPRLETHVDASPTPAPPGTGSVPRAVSESSAAGDLAEEDVATVLGRLAREGATCRVVFARGDARKTVWLEDGRPVFAASEVETDRLGAMLVREGKITREQRVRGREVMLATGRRLGEVLVEQGALKRRELYPAVRRHLEDVIFSLFAWDAGVFSVTPGGGARDEKIRLASPAAAILCEGVRRKVGLERLRVLVGPAHAVLAPGRREDLADALADADLGPDERQVLPLFDGQRSLAEISAEAGASELTVYQLAHLLRALGLLGVAGTTDAGRLTTGVSPPPQAGTADVAIDRERVLAKHAQVLEGDYFEILGVRPDATGHEVRRAFEAARRDFAPESFAAEVQRELAAELSSIAEVLAEAQRVLRDDATRAAYRDHLAAEPG